MIYRSPSIASPTLVNPSVILRTFRHPRVGDLIDPEVRRLDMLREHCLEPLLTGGGGLDAGAFTPGNMHDQALFTAEAPARACD